MILADTSVWVNHLAKPRGVMSSLLERGRIAMHPFVLGEIAVGSLRVRHQLLGDLHDLKTLPVASDDEVLKLIESRKLYGRGVGYVDCHLLSSVLLSESRLWTEDKRMLEAATELGIAI